jgi:hypothetical protein
VNRPLLNLKIPYAPKMSFLLSRKSNSSALQEVNDSGRYCTINHSVIRAWGHAVAQCLRYCATNLKVAGSIPDGVIGIFHWHNPSVALWPWGQLSFLKKWVPEIISGGKSSRCVRLTTFRPSCADCRKIWERQPPGILRVSLSRPVMGFLYRYLIRD